MRVSEFVERVHGGTVNVSDIAVKRYMPMMDKKRFALDVIAACTDEVDGFVSVDRFKMKVYFTMKAIAAYTALEVSSDFDEMISQYDCICERGLMKQIMTFFVHDYNELRNVLDDELDSMLVQNSIDAQVVRVANKLIDLIDGIGAQLDGFSLNGAFSEKIDLGTLMEMFNK